VEADMKAKRIFLSAGFLWLLAIHAPSHAQPPELDSGSITPGEVFEHTFNSAGLYPYHCLFHPIERGSVQVTVVGPDSASVSITNLGFDPASVTVKPGGTVRWQNVGGSVHTVTSDTATRAKHGTWGRIKTLYR
jgi:plastocyanin